MPTRRRLSAAGCKMNDAGYPFRGEYKVQPSLNHGHSGVHPAKGTTSLNVCITGSNLRIERMQANRDQTVKCELGVGSDTPRTVSFPTGSNCVHVPGDGREYHLITSVHGAGSRHVCHLVLNGSEGCSTLRVRAPPDPRAASAVILTCDGARVLPENGWYAIPIHAQCVAVDVAPPPAAAPTAGLTLPTAAGPAGLTLPTAAGPAGFTLPTAAGPAGFTLQCVPGEDAAAVLRCAGSGAAIALAPFRPVALAAESGPFTLQLPRAEFAAAPEIALETRVTAPPEGGDSAAPPVFAATAHGFRVELFGDNGASAAGEGSAALRLPDRAAHCVSITLRDAAGRPVMRHAHAVAASHPPSLLPHILEKIPAGDQPANIPPRTATATADVPPVPTSATAPPVPGTADVPPVSETTTVPPVPATAAVPPVPTGATVPPVPASAAVPPAPHPSCVPADAEPQWVAQLAAAISAPDINAARRAVQCIAAPGPHAAAIISFVSGELLRAPPVLSFDCAAGALTNVRCAGHRVTAAADGEAPALIADGGGARSGAPGACVTLFAAAADSGRAAVSVRARLPPPESSADEMLIARLADACERRAGDGAALAAEINALAERSDAAAFSGAGARLLRRLPLALAPRPASAPGTLQSATAPGTFQSATAPGTFQSATAPGTFQSSTAPGTFQSATAPGTLQSATAPGTFQSATAPGTLQSATAPGTFQSATAPGTLQSANIFARALVDAYFSPAAAPLRDRWAAVPARLPEERALADLLSQLLRDCDAAATAAAAATLSECVEFAVDAGVVRDVRTRAARALSAAVDGAGFAALAQGGRVPPAYALAPGAAHVVHIVARDPVTGASRAEVRVSLPAAHDAFVDAAIARANGADAQLRISCAPHLRVECEVDGAPAGAVAVAPHECVLRAAAAAPHAALVKLRNATGECVFTQRLSIPPLVAPRLDIYVSAAALRVAVPESAVGISCAASVDRAAERETSGGLIALNTNEPHDVRLCQYAEGACVGEVELHLSAFVAAEEVRDVARAYRTVRTGGELRTMLEEIRARTPSGVLRDLLVALIDAVPAVTSAEERGTGTGRTAHLDEPRIHIRLSGDERATSPSLQHGRSGVGITTPPRRSLMGGPA